MAWADLEGSKGNVLPSPPGKLQVAIGFLRNTGTCTNPRGPTASRGRSVRPSVKNTDD